MSAVVLANPKEIMREHLRVLREYAHQVLCKGEQLTLRQGGDCAGRLDEFFIIGNSVGLTPEELVHRLFHGVLVPASKCGGPCKGQRIKTHKEGQ